VTAKRACACPPLSPVTPTEYVPRGLVADVLYVADTLPLDEALWAGPAVVFPSGAAIWKWSVSPGWNPDAEKVNAAPAGPVVGAILSSGPVDGLAADGVPVNPGPLAGTGRSVTCDVGCSLGSVVVVVDALCE